MKTKVFSKLTIASMFISLLAPLAVLVPQVSAAAVTWDGEGADNNWSTAANWSGDAVPVDGDSLTFDFSVLTQSETLNNDLDALDISGLNLTGTPADYYNFDITGNEIILSGDITGNQTEGALYLDLDVTFGSDVTYSVADSRVVFGNFESVPSLDIGAYNLTYASPFVECRNLYINSSLSGSGNIISSSGSSGIILSKASTAFLGDITINGYGLNVYADVLLGFNNTITMNGSSILTLVGAATFDPAEIIMNSSANAALRANPYVSNVCAGGGLGDPGTTVLAGDLTLQRDTIFEGYNDLEVEGTFTANGHKLTTKNGSTGSITTSEGTIETKATTTTIDADDKSTAFLSVKNKETTILNGERGYVSIGVGGILKGTGSAETIYVSGGTLSPGLSPGCLTVTESGLTFYGGTYEVEIAGTTACDEYDQVDVTGVVDLDNDPTLDTSILDDFVPALDDEFIIISNDGTDEVTGEFDGMANGSTFEVDGVTFRINYDGGDGNDVVLSVTAVDVVDAPDTGLERLVTSNPLITTLAAFSVLTMLAATRYATKR